MADTFENIWLDRRVNIGYETAEELAKKFNEANWRGHPEGQADSLDESLDALHWIGSVKVNIQSGRIFDGHLRVKRALVKNPLMPIPVDYYDLSPDEELLALQVHDAITEQAQPIPDKLAALMERTKHLTADRPGLREMLEQLKHRAGINGNGHDSNGQEPPTPTETEAEKLAKEYGVKVGQVWALGRHVVACIDSTDESAVKELIGDKVARMVWADPPYGIGLTSDTSKLQREKDGWRNKPKDYAPVIGDDKPFDYSPFKWIDCKEQFWWGADYYYRTLPDGGSWLVWDKRVEESLDTMLGSMFELCWSRYPHKREIIRARWIGLHGTESQDIRYRIHPTQKPLQLPEEIFTRHGHPEDLIFDPFLGSGISILAAERLNDGRRVIGCELAPEYIGVTIFRWQQLSGQSPRLISG